MAARNTSECEEFQCDPEEQDLIYSVILECVNDNTSYLSKLQGTPYIVKKIWEMCRDFYWKPLIKLPQSLRIYDDDCRQELEDKTSYLQELDGVRFPTKNDININMMPFIMAYDFNSTKLPEYLREYYDNMIRVDYVMLHMWKDVGKICYISVQESMVSEKRSQRRPGLHTENPGKLCLLPEQAVNKGEGEFMLIHNFWGGGYLYDSTRLDGGIYMASNVEDSCKVWNCNILPRNNGDEIIGNLGNIEHLRHMLPEGEMMKANTMYWITDRTPHESLPIPKETYRQWFRLVTSKVSLWFEDHSTKNPNGVVPDPEITKIVKGSKFQKETLHVVSQDKANSTSKKSKSKHNLGRLGRMIRKRFGKS